METVDERPTEPRSEPRERTPWWRRVLDAALPDAGATTYGREARAYRRPRSSFTDELPYVDVVDNQIVLADGATRVAVYEIEPIPTEARSQEVLEDSLKALHQVFTETVPTYARNPWVMQIYAGETTDIGEFGDQVERYVDERGGANRPYARNHIEMTRQHLKDVSRQGGYFFDESVLGDLWRGRYIKIRLVIYRKYFKARSENSPEELDEICGKLETNLRGLGSSYTRLGGKEFYRWLRDWFNPRPPMCDGDPSRLDEIAPYPGDEEMPFGRDFATMLTLSKPEVHRKSGIWLFDGMPHVVVTMLGFQRKPVIGQLTGELEFNEKRWSLMDRLPPGTVVAMTVVAEPRDVAEARLDKIRTTAVGGSDDAIATYNNATAVLRRLKDSNDELFPMEIAFFVRAESAREIRRVVNETRSVLSARGIATNDPWKDPIQEQHFRRHLPAVFIPALERKATRRARAQFARDAAKVAPCFGRTKGTGNPALLAFNRGGEPIGIDPLNKKDRRKNAHAFVVGPTGAGKSVWTGAAIESMIATHNARVILIEAGNSFGLLAREARRHGVSVNRMKLGMSMQQSIPPFADLLRVLEDEELRNEAERIERGHEEELTSEEEVLEKNLRQLAEEDDDLADEDEGEEEERRDYVSEAEMIIRVMLRSADDETGGGIRVTSSMRRVIRRSAVLAAQNVAAENARNASAGVRPRVVLPEDIAKAISEIGLEEQYGGMQRDIQEMADAVSNFCDGLGGHLFNRSGQLWPEADLTLVDLGATASKGAEEELAIAILSLLMAVQRMVERDQMLGRQTIVMIDECHIIANDVMLMAILTSIVKTWRKLGTWLWCGTQNFDDFPESAAKLLSMFEFWVCLSLESDEIEKARRLKGLSREIEIMLGECTKTEDYSEGVIFSDRVRTLARFVPPPRMLALIANENHEKNERRQLMEEYGVNELDAALMVGERMRREKLGLPPEERLRIPRPKSGARSAKSERRARQSEESAA